MEQSFASVALMLPPPPPPPPLPPPPPSPPPGSIPSLTICVLAADQVRVYSQDDPSRSDTQPDLQVSSSAAASLLPPSRPPLSADYLHRWKRPNERSCVSDSWDSPAGRGSASGRGADAVKRQRCGRGGELSAGFIVCSVWVPLKW